MADLIYKKIMNDLKGRILNGEFTNQKLPDERTLSEEYEVSVSTIRRSLSAMVEQGIIFKKRGSGTFINPLYIKNRSFFNYEGSNLGITDSVKNNSQQAISEVLEYEVVQATKELQQDLLLENSEFVYHIKRLRLINDQPVIIETGYIPIKILPSLTPEVVKSSIFNYLQEVQEKSVTKSFISIMADKSTKEDQVLLGLSESEPVAVMEGIFFLDDGTPFEFSNMRIHYKYLKYNTFVDLDQE